MKFAAFQHFYHQPALLFQEGRFHLRPFVQFLHCQTSVWAQGVCRKALGTPVVKASVKLIGGACVLTTTIQKVRFHASLFDIATMLNVNTMSLCHIRQPTRCHRRLFGFPPVPHVQNDSNGFLLEKHGAKNQIAQGSGGDNSKGSILHNPFTVLAKFRHYLSNSSSMLRTTCFLHWVYHL